MKNKKTYKVTNIHPTYANEEERNEVYKKLAYDLAVGLYNMKEDEKYKNIKKNEN